MVQFDKQVNLEENSQKENDNNLDE